MALVWTTVVVMLAAHAVYLHGLGRSPSGRSSLRPAAELIRARYPDAAVYVTQPGSRNVISAGGNDLSIHLNRPIRWAGGSLGRAAERACAGLVHDAAEGRCAPECRRDGVAREGSGRETKVRLRARAGGWEIGPPDERRLSRIVSRSLTSRR